MDLGGRSAQRLGFGRSLGQVYVAIYLSPKPLCLQELVDRLGISKGNASMSVRQLEAWGAVRRIWQRGDRRDYYEANVDFRALLRQTLAGFILPRIESAGRQIQDVETELETMGAGIEDGDFLKQRVRRLRDVQRKLAKILPFVERVLK
ncbi:MAG TPA: MarR family transcriptional regulator [Verrucomicrobiae bacterium]|nr:MarR family transcriptional regulator [Verrucomicrobiae bacterium]